MNDLNSGKTVCNKYHGKRQQPYLGDSFSAKHTNKSQIKVAEIFNQNPGFSIKQMQTIKILKKNIVSYHHLTRDNK